MKIEGTKENLQKLVKTIPIDKSNDLVGLLPEPTLDDPYAQLHFIFDRVAKLKLSKSTKSNIKAAKSFYINRFLARTNNNDQTLLAKKLFYLQDQWDSYALIKVNSYIDAFNIEGSKDRLASHTIVGHMSAIRQVMEYAALHNLTKDKNIYNVALPIATKETTQHTSYSDEEMDAINNMLKNEIDYINKILSRKGYQKTGIGRNPQIHPENVPKGARYPIGWGWKEPNNMRWYFENKMDCQALSGTPEHKKEHGSFFQNVGLKYAGGLNALYRSWGVAAIIDHSILMPLAMKLILETGLNPESLWLLTIDCFQERHPLSGVPYLQYYKERSKGNMEMHLSIYDKNIIIREYKENQANIIRKTISQILNLTVSVREKAPNNLKRFLFLYQTTSSRKYGEICVLNIHSSSDWCGKISFKYNLFTSTNQRLKLNMVRFRSTKITDMVKKGYDFFEIQSHAGHKSIITTLKYISQNKLEVKAQNDIKQALIQIHENRAWVISETPTYSTSEYDNGGSKIFKGVLSDCRNVYDPPDIIKNAPGYITGQACTRFNMCLFCKNVIIMSHNLPMIAYYKQQILSSLENNSAELPNYQYYQKTLGVIDKILDPLTSEFSKEEIENAVDKAKFLDEMIDPVVYRPYK